MTAEANDILDELAQQAAIEAIRNASVVLFCVDISKNDWTEDVLIYRLISAKTILPVATKMDLPTEKDFKIRLAKLDELFGLEFLPVSSKTESYIDLLRERISEKLSVLMVPYAEAGSVALTERHKKIVADAIENISEAIKELEDDNDEVAAMMLRGAIQSLSGIEHEHIDEKLLDRIFSRFCIGK